MRGVWPGNLFKIHFDVKKSTDNDEITVKLNGSALFTNFLPFKKALDNLPEAKKVTLDLSNAYLIDHTVMEYMLDFINDYEAHGGQDEQVGNAIHTFSDHDLAARLITEDSRKHE